MHQVHLELNDKLYDRAKRRAAESGFGSVDEYIKSVVADGVSADSENFDHLFTPERIALIDKAAAQIEAGLCMTAKEADAELKRRRTEWLRNNPA